MYALFPKPFRLTLGHALLLGLVVRLCVLAFFPDQGFPDAKAYLESGESLFTTGLMSTIEYMPLYPIWTFIWGGGLVLDLADIALSVMTIWLVHRMALVLFDDPGAATLAALGASVYPHFVFYAVTGLTETAYLFLVCAAFLALYKRRYLAGSILIVLSILVRPTLDFLAPILLVAFVVGVHKESVTQSIKPILTYCAVYVVLMTPWWIHNFEKYEAFVRLNLGDGIVLYSGNNPLNTSGGGVNYSPGEEGYEEHGSDRDMARFEEIEDRVERNKILKQAALDYILDNPERFVELATVKFVRFWRLWPYAPKYNKPHLIAVSLLSYGVVLVLSIWFCLRHLFQYWRMLLPVLLFTIYLSAVHMVTIGSIRYRLPLEPFLIIIAGRALSDLLAPMRWSRIFGGRVYQDRS